ncbi:MAG: hypothetical protein NVS3B10_29020 [Polyangiales bacterium]
MDRSALHLEIRNALSVADELSRHEHYLGHDDLAGGLSALRSALGDLERDVGRSHADVSAPDPDAVEGVERSLQSLIIRRHDVPRSLRARTEELLASAERVSIALWDPTEPVPSKPLLGSLPLARVLPQDVHSVLDYVHAAGFFVSAKLARTGRARAVGIALGAGIGGASAVTDYRLSAAKLLPIELHETLDYAGGITAIAAPFVLGYVKKDPIAALIHIGLGIGTVVTSLFTDYRASKGRTWPNRSKGGPMLGLPRGENGVRVGEVQRPLEGLSSAPTGWNSDAMRDDAALR